jgi:hypothetical protein
MAFPAGPILRRLLRFRGVLLCALVLLLGLATSYRLGAARSRDGLNDARAEVASALDRVRGDLSRELFTALSLPQALFGLVSLRGTIDQAEFDGLAATLLERTSLIRDLALAPDNVVRFVYPRAGNEAAIGLDYLRTPGQRDSVLQAIAERRTVVAGPVDLAQGGVGIIGRAPIFPRRSPAISLPASDRMDVVRSRPGGCTERHKPVGSPAGSAVRSATSVRRCALRRRSSLLPEPFNGIVWRGIQEVAGPFRAAGFIWRTPCLLVAVASCSSPSSRSRALPRGRRTRRHSRRASRRWFASRDCFPGRPGLAR